MGETSSSLCVDVLHQDISAFQCAITHRGQMIYVVDPIKIPLMLCPRVLCVSSLPLSDSCFRLAAAASPFSRYIV